MTYTSIERLEKRFGAIMLVQLTDRGPQATGMMDLEVIEQELANTDAVINASLARRYRLPLVDVPPVVADLALSIAIYKLHVTRPDEKIERDYEQALKDLISIANGTKVLDLAGVEPATSGAGGVIATDRDRPLTANSLRGFI